VLLAVTSGLVKVSAGAGERWKVRYSLDYTVLRAIAVVLSIAAVVMGLSAWPRLTLVNVIAGIWVLVYFAPRWAAGRRFDDLVRDSATEVLERRHTPRDLPAM
jgi:predicted membrane protein